MRKVLFASLIAILLLGCAKEPEKVSNSSNPKVQVEQLFTYDGCKVFRFYDHGNSHYFTKCPNNLQTISSHTENCGKNCYETVTETIPTDTY